MTDKNGAAGHHSSAASHHEQAARHHREASRHFQIGKDYAHAAHLALVAHGHALLAVDRGNGAGKHYVEQNGEAFPIHPEPLSRNVAKSPEATETMQISRSGAEHHNAAADHHEQAARHHGQAATHWDVKDHARATHEARMAYGHAQLSVFHGNEATKHHVEHYGRAGPTAEIL